MPSSDTEVSAAISIVGKIKRSAWKTKEGMFLYILKDIENRIFTITSASSDFQIGQKWNIHGIVKRVNCFKKQKQTHLTKWALFKSYGVQSDTCKQQIKPESKK